MKFKVSGLEIESDREVSSVTLNVYYVDDIINEEQGNPQPEIEEDQINSKSIWNKDDKF